MKKLIALLLAIVIVCMCAAPAFAASGVKIINKKYASDINSGETFKYKTTWGIGKPKLTIKDDNCVKLNDKTIRIKIWNASTGKTISNSTYRIKDPKTCVTLSLPNKSVNYKVQVTVLKDATSWTGVTPSFTATVTRGTLSK